MILARITQTAVNVGAYFHVRVFKSYINRQHNMSIRRTAIKIHIFKIKVVRVKLIFIQIIKKNISKSTINSVIENNNFTLL